MSETNTLILFKVHLIGAYTVRPRFNALLYQPGDSPKLCARSARFSNNVSEIVYQLCFLFGAVLYGRIFINLYNTITINIVTNIMIFSFIMGDNKKQEK